MPKSFIKFKGVLSNSEKHNTREMKVDNMIEPSNQNFSAMDESIADRLEKIRATYEKNIGQKMQKKAKPIREATVLLPDDKNEVNSHLLFKLSDELEKRFGIKTFQWHIHNDEGHKDKVTGELKYNYHAHLVVDWTNEEGRSLRLNSDDMIEIQTLTAEILQMERGERGSKTLSLNHREYRGFMEIRDKLSLEFNKELTEDQEVKIREEIVERREELKAKKDGDKKAGRGEIKR